MDDTVFLVTTVNNFVYVTLHICSCFLVFAEKQLSIQTLKLLVGIISLLALQDISSHLLV